MCFYRDIMDRHPEGKIHGKQHAVFDYYEHGKPYYLLCQAGENLDYVVRDALDPKPDLDSIIRQLREQGCNI